jgi:hypothetical protein
MRMPGFFNFWPHPPAPSPNEEEENDGKRRFHASMPPCLQAYNFSYLCPLISIYVTDWFYQG